jgi:hypothetical protein
VIYSVQEGGRTQTYEGFCSFKMPRPLDATYLAIATVEGESEPWWVQSNGLALEELRRYYRSTYSMEVTVELFVPLEGSGL